MDISYQVETEAQFWTQLEDSVKENRSAFLSDIDHALTSFVNLAARYYGVYLTTEEELNHCSLLLLGSWLFEDFSDRCINTLLDFLVGADTSRSAELSHVCLHVLSIRAQDHAHVYQMMRQTRVREHNSGPAPVPIVVMMDAIGELQPSVNGVGVSGEPAVLSSDVRVRLGREATRVLYDVCRISRLDKAELDLFEEPFVEHLFHLVESTRDGDELFNYALIRLIIALNEQFMVASASSTKQSEVPRTHHKKPSSTIAADNNIILRTMKAFLGSHKTFGENLIFILNRCDSGSSEDLCVSLLILKILYLLFTTPCTSEYFYTNDLRVLVDVFLRELNDLPEESEGLRHTYLRVLHPLLINTQLKSTSYKRRQLRHALQSLVDQAPHRAEATATTKRLVNRNLNSHWCLELTEQDLEAQLLTASPVAEVPSPEPVSPCAFDVNPRKHRQTNSVIYQEHDESNRRGSTLSMSSVADAATPDVSGRKRRSHSGADLSPPPVPSRIKSPLMMGSSMAGLSLGQTVSVNPAAAFVQNIVDEHDAMPGVRSVADVVNQHASTFPTLSEPPPSPASSFSSTATGKRRQPPAPPANRKKELNLNTGKGLKPAIPPRRNRASAEL